MNTTITGSFSRLVVIKKIMSRYPVTNHLQDTKQFYAWVNCFFTNLAFSLDPKLIFTCKMVENNVNHVTINLERTFELFFSESRDWTNPVAEDTLLCPLGVILYAGLFRLIGRWGSHQSVMLTFTSQGGRSCSSMVCMTTSRMRSSGMGISSRRNWIN